MQYLSVIIEMPSSTFLYYMAGSASGQDESNPAL